VIYAAMVLLAVAAAAGAAVYQSKKSAAERAPGRCGLISEDLLEFLENADDAYILAHETTEIGRFSRFAAGEVCHELLEGIFKNPPKMFGTRKYRRRRWSVIEHDPDWMVIRKQVYHVPVKASKGIYVALGDEMEEIWTISCLERGYRIVDVNDR
jgi:hypothetical protein